MYVVSSLIAHLKAGRWLTALGTLGTDWSDERVQLERELAEMERKHSRLTEEYQAAMDLLTQMGEPMPDSNIGEEE